MRKSTVAGSWYPGSREKLTAFVQKMLDAAEAPEIKGRPFGLISPHAGIEFSGKAAACGFKTLQKKNIKRVILMGPSHYTYLQGIAVSGVNFYETPLGKIRVEQDICASLSRHSLFQGPSQTEIPEHSLEMQLPFLQMVLGNFDLVPLVVGELGGTDFTEAATELKQHVTDETVIVASSDFTHYGRRFGYVPFRENVKKNLAQLDGGALNKILDRDAIGFLQYVEQTGATICGCRPIGILLHLLPKESIATKLAYYTSGDLLQDYTDTVSYAAVVFTAPLSR